MAKLIKKIFQNSGYLSMNLIVKKTLFLFLLVYISKIMGLEFLGQYIMLFIIFSVVFTRLGYLSLIIRTIVENKKKTALLFGNTILTELIILPVRLLVLTIYIYYMGFSSEFIIALVYIVIAGVICTFSNITKIIFYAYQKMKNIFIGETIANTITVFTGIILLHYGHGISGLAIAYMTANLILFFVYIFQLLTQKFPMPIFKINITYMKWLVNNSWPFIVSKFFLDISTKTNILILHFFTDLSTVGLYGAMGKIIITFDELYYTYIISAFPQFSLAYKHSIIKLKKLYSQVKKYGLIIVIVFGSTLFIVARPLILILYHVEFLSGIVILRIMICTLVLGDLA